jgi:hypothetical protein
MPLIAARFNLMPGRGYMENYIISVGNEGEAPIYTDMSDFTLSDNQGQVFDWSPLITEETENIPIGYRQRQIFNVRLQFHEEGRSDDLKVINPITLLWNVNAYTVNPLLHPHLQPDMTSSMKANVALPKNTRRGFFLTYVIVRLGSPY